MFDNHIQNIWVAQRKRVKEKSLEIELYVCVCVLGVARKGAEKEVKEKRIDRQGERKDASFGGVRRRGGEGEKGMNRKAGGAVRGGVGGGAVQCTVYLQ